MKDVTRHPFVNNTAWHAMCSGIDWESELVQSMGIVQDNVSKQYVSTVFDLLSIVSDLLQNTETFSVEFCS